MANGRTETAPPKRSRGSAPEGKARPASGDAQSRDPRFETLSGIPVQPLYTAADLPPGSEAQMGRPGEFPFTRGLHPEMYRTRLWTMRQFAGFGTAEHTN